MKWLKDGGATFDKIKIRYYTTDYRGVHARRVIRKNEMFLTIPENLLITLEMAKATPMGAKMERADLYLLSPKHSFLSSFVLQERLKPDTKWEPYFDILPKYLTSFPIFFTPEEKSWLEGSPFLGISDPGYVMCTDQVEEKIADIARDYQTITKAVPEFAQFSLQEFSQVRMLVSSRIFGISIRKCKTDALVPLAGKFLSPNHVPIKTCVDMLNHKRPQQTAWEYKDPRGAFVIESKEEIRRGEQVYDSYGKKCNSRFFLNYGFIVENNDANEVPIVVSLDETDPLLEVKRKILGVLDSKKIRVSEDLTEKNMHNFFSFLRFSIFRGDPMQLYNYQFQQNATKKSEDEDEQPYEGTNIPPLTIENEKQVLLSILRLAQKQLAAYPTSYEADLKLLEESKDLTWNHRNALLMRSGEKKAPPCPHLLGPPLPN